MDKILPYTPMVWTAFALSSDKAQPASSADVQAGVWMAAALLAVIAGCLLLVVARWLAGFVRELYERVRQAREPRTRSNETPDAVSGLRGPLWVLSGLCVAQVSHGLLKDVNAGQRLGKTET